MEFKPLTLNSFATIMAFLELFIVISVLSLLLLKSFFFFFNVAKVGASQSVLSCLVIVVLALLSPFLTYTGRFKLNVSPNKGESLCPERWKTLPLRRFFNCAPPVYSKLGSPIMQMTQGAERKKF